MTTATERIPVLVTTAEKSMIAKMAKDAGISMGELLRRAASSYSATADEEILAGMINQMNQTSAQAGSAIDEALALIEASNKRIDAMERKAA